MGSAVVIIGLDVGETVGEVVGEFVGESVDGSAVVGDPVVKI